MPKSRATSGLIKFPPEIKKVRVDVGLSNEAYHSCEWLLKNDDVGVVGIEANPHCLTSLVEGGTKNSNIPTLFLREEKICKYVGEISSDFLASIGFQFRGEGKDYVNIGNSMFWLGKMSTHMKPSPFQVFPFFTELGDIRGRYFLVWGAVDNVSTKSLKYQKFYSTYPDLGTSSLRKDIIEERTDKHAPTIREELMVPSFSLEYLFDHFDWETYEVIECLKTDAEGKDFDIIQSCGKYLSKIAFIRAEAFDHSDPTMSTYGLSDKLVAFLEQNGFELFDREPGDFKFKNKKLANLIEANQLGWE